MLALQSPSEGKIIRGKKQKCTHSDRGKERERRRERRRGEEI